MSEEKKDTKVEVKAEEAHHDEGGPFLRNRREFLGAFAGIVGAAGAAQMVVPLLGSHLGCLVKWYEAENKFKCPCHDGWFDEHGVNKGGPPPAPLDKLEYKLAGDKLIVGGA
jgi:Rieske Fe-S protein